MEVRKGYKQTEIGVIPEDWEVAPVGEAYEICNNLRLPISRTVRKQMEGPYPYYGPTSIQGYINEYRVEGEYALIGEDGDHFLKWQEQSMTLLVHGRFNVNNHAHLIKGTKNVTTWFYYYFAHRDITSYLTRQGAGRFKLNKRTLMEIPCALPPRPEQEAIAEALSDAGALIEALEQLIAKKRQVKQGAMQELLTGKRRLSGFNGKWNEKKLGDIAEITKLAGFEYSKYFNSYKDGGDIIVIRGTNITHNKLDLSDIKTIPQSTSNFLQRSKLQQGDLVFAYVGTIGPVYLITENNKYHLGPNTARITVEDNVSPQFVFWYFCSSFAKKEIDEHISVGAQPSLSMTKIRKFKISLPEYSEQNAIAEILSDMDAEIAALEDKLVKARQVKQGMMQELLTGRIRLVESGKLKVNSEKRESEK